MQEIEASRLPYGQIEKGAGVHEKTISKLKAKNPDSPDLKTVCRLAEYMGFKVWLVPVGRKPVDPGIERLAREATERRRRERLAKTRGVDVPSELEPDWQLLRRSKFTPAEAAAALGLEYKEPSP